MDISVSSTVVKEAAFSPVCASGGRLCPDQVAIADGFVSGSSVLFHWSLCLLKKYFIANKMFDGLSYLIKK